ncbi:MAG: hypothetical protein GY699_23160, partial [Desulfobacteraceae bacterium]|nr:hypothetical protein [Desulfobacteraceae bacterium]
ESNQSLELTRRNAAFQRVAHRLAAQFNVIFEKNKMPIHLISFKKKSDLRNHEPLWEIDDMEIEHLALAFENYNKKTGYRIEEYSDIYLTPGNLQPLKEVVSDLINIERAKNIQSSLRKFLEFIQRAEKENKGLAFLGE